MSRWSLWNILYTDTSRLGNVVCAFKHSNVKALISGGKSLSKMLEFSKSDGVRKVKCQHDGIVFSKNTSFVTNATTGAFFCSRLRPLETKWFLMVPYQILNSLSALCSTIRSAQCVKSCTSVAIILRNPFRIPLCLFLTV